MEAYSSRVATTCINSMVFIYPFAIVSKDNADMLHLIFEPFFGCPSRTAGGTPLDQRLGLPKAFEDSILALLHIMDIVQF